MTPEAVEHGNDQAGNGADKERRAPAPERANLPARKITQRRAYGDRHVKDGEDAIALALGVEIGQNGRGEDAECGLTDTHESLADIESPIVVNPDGGQSGQAPENSAKDDKRLARGTVGKPRGRRLKPNISDQQNDRHRAQLEKQRPIAVKGQAGHHAQSRAAEKQLFLVQPVAQPA